MSKIDFDYDLEEIVQMSGRGPLTLAGALRRMPDASKASRSSMRPYLVGDFGLILSGFFDECIANPTRSQ